MPVGQGRNIVSDTNGSILDGLSQDVPQATASSSLPSQLLDKAISWWMSQPSWMDQAAQLEQDETAQQMFSSPEALDRRINFARGMVSPSALTFGGKLALTADRAMLEKAWSMFLDGATPEAIWNETGWFRGAEGDWKFEIPDKQSRIGQQASQDFMGPDQETGGKAAGVLWHQPLYAAYPKLRNIDVDAVNKPYYGGSFAGDHISAQGPNLESLRNTMLHEMQHGVQQQEGFATGSNPFGLKPDTPAWDIYQERLQSIRDAGKMTHEEFSKRAGYEGLAPLKEYQEFVKSTKKIDPAIDVAAQQYAAQEAYRRSAGEVEARNVQYRKNMTPEQLRARPPWTTEDVPRDKQIVKRAQK